MKRFKKVVSVLLCLIFACSFASCNKEDNGETTETASPTELQSETQKGESAKEDEGNKEDESGNLLITLCNADSDKYHSLQGEIKTFDTGIDADYGLNGFRFVSPKNGVKVRLEAIMWSSLVDEFEATETVFEIETEKGKIYEFTCYLTETIPDFRLVAEYGEMKSTYYMATDGESAKNVIEMTDEDFVPEEITVDSVFYNLCVARAVSDVFYNDRLVKYETPVVLDTFAYAVTANYNMLNGVNQKEAIVLNQWESYAYFNALYPQLNGKIPELPDVTYVFESMEPDGYLEVTPHVFGSFCDSEFYGVEDNGDGTYSVKIRIDDYRYEGYAEFGLAVIVKPDANNPFGYVITDVVDCELPRG